MNTLTIPRRATLSLRTVLALDAATCALMGIGLIAAAAPLAGPLGLPSALLQYAGIALLPIAAFVAWVAVRPSVFRPGVWMVIVGNVLWVIASLAVVAAAWFSPTLLGTLFVTGQAVAVVGLAAMEYLGLQRS